MELSKKFQTGALVALFSSLALNIWFSTRPKPQPEKIEVEKIVTVDRVVIENRDVVRTVTKANGTKRVTETKTEIREVEKKAEREESKAVYNSKARYSLTLSGEVGVSLYPIKVSQLVSYEAEVGFRLADLPLWLTVSADSKKTLGLGLRYEF